jgi:hypothetical protein
MKILKITLITLFALASIGLMAQKGQKKAENMADNKAKMEAFLTEKLELTDAEKTASFPVYNQFQTEKRALRAASKAMRQKGRKMEELSDAELDEVMQASFEMKQKELDLKKKYHEKFKQVLPMKKVAKLYMVEKKMVSHMKQNRKKGDRSDEKRPERNLQPSER